MVLLVTSDNKQFVVDKEVADCSAILRGTSEAGGSLLPAAPTSYLADLIPLDPAEADDPIPLPNVSSSVLKKGRRWPCHCVRWGPFEPTSFLS